MILSQCQLLLKHSFIFPGKILFSFLSSVGTFWLMIKKPVIESHPCNSLKARRKNTDDYNFIYDIACVIKACGQES